MAKKKAKKKSTKKASTKQTQEAEAIEVPDMDLEYIEDLKPVINEFIQKRTETPLNTKDDIVSVINICNYLSQELNEYKAHLDTERSTYFLLEREAFVWAIDTQKGGSADERKARALCVDDYKLAKAALDQIDSLAAYTMRTLGIIENVYLTHFELLNSLDWDEGAA